MQVLNSVKDYAEVMGMERPKHIPPKRPNIFFRTLLKVVSSPDLMATKFEVKKVGMERLPKKQAALFLMNHSSFIDLEIASSILYPRPFNIVTTLDAFIGKDWLMRQIGCIPTRKFVADLGLIKDINKCIKKNNTSVLMFPEAGYTLDGTATVLPDSLAHFVKRLGAPVVMIETFGAFHRKPLYNELNAHKLKVSAEMRYVLSPEELQEKTVSEIAEILAEQFSFDAFRWQQQNGILITEENRADGLQRLLYKCPACGAEGKTVGKGVHLECTACNKKWGLTEDGIMRAVEGDTEFPQIHDWFRWERQCVIKELDDGTYGLDEDVDVYMIVNTKGVYKVGDGHLTHTKDGFHLVGCDGRLDYTQNSISLYTLNADFYWYKLGDVIGFGNMDALYFCIPKDTSVPVAKARLATEEIFKRIKK